MDNRFKSKYDAFSRAKRFHVCLSCRHYQSEKYEACPKCESRDRQHFPSETEFKRAMTLLMLADRGKIERLRFHPAFPLSVNNVVLGKYIADCDYYQDGVYIIEDSKPEKFLDSFSKWKIRHCQAQYGVVITIPQHKKGKL